ncbi:hypothetical protein [Blastopirellula marina]|uniref:Uncharacterized protein n=1 Tax=Blastopirellula marina TaxID=124 RepID=A0A2S8GDF5_9BACT|nr:hypothetical protein [Blastopirellula marina]PQO42340.1 hypothetical protein C5Y93_28810 [Blastopirellula marina]
MEFTCRFVFNDGQVVSRKLVLSPGPGWQLQVEPEIAGESLFVRTDATDCLRHLRQQCEAHAVIPLCHGARKNFVQSPMQLDCGGMAGYLVNHGQPASEASVPIFGDCEPDEVGSLAEQVEFKKRWLSSLR